jgi:hypothetical protein
MNDWACCQQLALEHSGPGVVEEHPRFLIEAEYEDLILPVLRTARAAGPRGSQTSCMAWRVGPSLSSSPSIT